ncbi:VOC family protein [Eubacterium barkeri]|uniref:Catechol 2,3-dioxygenase n=1 Tax=Eubacterium barkeri TaxID=1528 RepID=A0A1H3ET97_EUBBA|nr:VOC family protein [Eubacterium barkeri]SDX81318.1 Catechol 2,3-dioxygenase [Eubacterium barkeri]
MKFKLPLLAVQNVDVSKKFYQRFFDQDVVMDLGKNVTFSGGFAIQEDFPWLTDIDPASVVSKSHNMELYFEVEDFDAFLKRLEGQESIVYVHPPKKHEWQQRVLRIYDPDGHMIEIGESMAVIARRYLDQGLSVEAVSEIIQHPVSFVEGCARDDGVAIE